MSKFIERRNQGSGPTPPIGGGGAGNAYLDLAIDGGVKNGNVGANIINGLPYIEYFKKPSGFGSSAHTVSLPSNYADGYSMMLTLFWSAMDSGAGAVNWNVQYNFLSPFTSSVLQPVSTTGILQSTQNDGTLLLSTGSSLVIPGTTMDGSLLFINIQRLFDGTDSYNNSARLHLARLAYTQNST